MQIEAVYIHIPFCMHICTYCDFCKLFYDHQNINKYLTSLEQEIKTNYHNEVIKTIYIGGGTPSCLNIQELTKLFNIIKIFNLSDNYELTIECNIEDITKEKLELLKSNGITRISIGVQTTTDKYLEYLGRTPFNKEKLELATKYFSNINIDLIYAFKNETLEDIKKDLDTITLLPITHISIYSLIIEEHTRLYIDKTMYINDELEEQMYFYIINYLTDKGFKHYEISNFAKEGYESKHNLTYWNNSHYYGFGLGSSGYIANYRYTNTRNIEKYNNGQYIFNQDTLNKNIDMENTMMLGLRKIEGVNKNNFFVKYGRHIEEVFDIINLIDENMLIDDGEYIRIPEDKLYISNQILLTFIGGSSNE